MKLLSIQMAIFSKDVINRPDFLFNEINKKIGNIIDGIPTIINLPDGIPPEVPIVQASSSNGLVSLNVSRSRIDLFINFAYDDNTTPLELFNSKKGLLELFSTQVINTISSNRAGLILTFFKPNDNSVQAIFNKYFSEQYTPDVVESSLRVNKQDRNNGETFNNIITIEATTITNGINSIPGVLFQYDINNVLNHDININDKTIKHLLSKGFLNLSSESLKEMI